MSDYRDILMNAIRDGKILDSCGSDERYYDFGLYTDLCGMSVEDAIKATTQCCCNGGGNNTGSTKTNNPIIISAEENADGKYILKVKAAYPATAPVLVSFVVDGKNVTSTIPAGSSEATVDGILLDTKYATVGKIDITTSDEVYRYTAVSNIADGLFVLTYKIEGKTVHEVKVRAGSKIEKFEPEARKGYLFKGWTPEEPETMPENAMTFEGAYEAIPYYIVFKDAVNGDVRIECFYEKAIAKPEAPEKEGNEFKGWFMADGNEVPEILDFIPESEIEATAKYEPKSYELIYCNYDGSEWKRTTVKYDTVLVYEPDGPARVGYTFNGWDGKPADGKMPSKDVVLTALYIVNEWELVYSIQDDENPDITGVTYEKVAYDTVISDKTEAFAEEHKTDTGKYEFSWIGDEHETEKMPDSRLEIKAQRKVVKHTLKFVDAEGNEYSAITGDYNSDLAIEVNPSKTGYDFTGWDKEIPSKMPSEDMTFVSQFEVHKWAIKFEIENEKDVADTGYSIANIAYGTDLANIFADFEAKYPSVEGEYAFSWRDEEKPASMPDNDVLVTAKYLAVEHTLTFMSEGAEVQTVTGKFNTEVPTINEPTKTGYSFKGWDKEVPQVFPNADETFTAQFEINQYTVTINDENGSEITLVTVDYDTEIASIVLPEKEGYTFKGFESEFTNVPDKDITIVAKYQINQYKLTYEVDGETVKEVSYDYNADIETYKYEKEGYTVGEWSGLPENMKMPAHDVTASTTSTVNKYNVVFMADGEEYETIEVEYGAEIALPAQNPTKTGYDFKGWKNVPDTMPAQDLEIEAEFEILSFTLTFKNITDNVTVTAFTVEYGADLADYVAQAKALVDGKEGYTFSWDNTIPATMPAEDLTVEGSYKEITVNSTVYYSVIPTGESITEENVLKYNNFDGTEVASADVTKEFILPSSIEVTNALNEYAKSLQLLQDQYEFDEISKAEYNSQKQILVDKLQKVKEANTYKFVVLMPFDADILIKENVSNAEVFKPTTTIMINDSTYQIWEYNSVDLWASRNSATYVFNFCKK